MSSGPGSRATRRARVVRRLFRGLRRRVRLLRPATLRSLWWTERTLRQVRRDLPGRGTRLRAPAPPRDLPATATGAVDALLRRRGATCLQRCLVLQSWLSAHGRDHEIVVAVHTRDGFGAHAWLAGFDPDESDRWRELTRLAPGPAVPA